MAGQEFLESLDDGREVWIYGERVGKLTEHPAFRNAARMIARLFDALHDPRTKPSSAAGTSCTRSTTPAATKRSGAMRCSGPWRAVASTS